MFGFHPFRKARLLSSYADCPEIYYRFNGKEEYGPQKLERVVEFFEKRVDEPIECRFSDERQWRPLAYFFKLWEVLPISAHTVQRLKKEGLETDEMSESVARKLLRDRQNLKAPTPRQLERLRELGMSQVGLNRGRAEELIRERQKSLEDERKRVEEAPELEACNKRLEELKPQVRETLPDWNPPEFHNDLSSLSAYVDLVAEALEHAKSFDLGALQSDLFYDYVTEKDYYLEFQRDPTDVEMRSFQGAIFLNYLKTGSERFNHLSVLNRSLPMIKAERP